VFGVLLAGGPYIYGNLFTFKTLSGERKSLGRR